MNTAAIKRMTIVQALSHIPETYLDSVKTYVDTLMKSTWTPPSINQSLEGIWKDIGFEKIMDLEEEIQDIRHEIQTDILARKP
uniref:DUF2281 domain-containing protein n=1 Tax=Candidatus Kentrum sp. SD TaxID=2126332 RepID=A0A451BN79_9GAMM|nr:MAG: hypothetical protein BECKSD772D_GA0070982_10642 [Candidatus Kentron sp. SD]